MKTSDTSPFADSDMTLYYMPGSCALGVHIALEWTSAAYTAQAVSYPDLRKPEYLALNPSGVVPTLKVGEQTLTEASAIMLALARQFPSLAPNDQSRFEFERSVIYLGGTLHPHFWPWFAPTRYGANSPSSSENTKKAAEDLIAADFARLDGQLEVGPYMLGDQRTAVDAYLFPMARWGYELQKGTAEYPNLDRFMRRMVEDEGVKSAMSQQGLPPMFVD